MLREQAARRTQQPSVTTKTGWRSGFCGLTHPPDSHARCRGYNGKHGDAAKPCVCACHQTPASEETALAPSSSDVEQQPGQPVAATPAPRSPVQQLEIAEPTIIRDLSEADYHGQRGSLSASGAKWLIPPSPCPAKFRHYQEHQEQKKVYDFGHVVHRLVLGKGDEIEVLPFDSMRSNAAKDAEAAARDADRVPILQEEYQRAQAVAAAVRCDPIGGALFSDGEAELSLFWPDEDTGIIRRARLDWITNPVKGRRRFIGDLKTARTAEPLGFGRSAADYDYIVSAANYVDGAIACGLDPDPAFLLVVAEKDEPYVVTTFQVTDDELELGRRLMRSAITTYAQCVKDDHWPGYTEGVTPLELPGYYTSRIEDYLT
jgi:hypothetical protein